MKYTKPISEIEEFKTVDVIATSVVVDPVDPTDPTVPSTTEPNIEPGQGQGW